MDSTVTVVGTVGRDPELRFISNGSAVVGFSLAVNRRYKKDDEWESETSWTEITVWGEMAENVSQSIFKGHRVIVFGRLKEDQWEAPDGAKRSKLKIVADAIGPDLKWATVQVDKIERDSPRVPTMPAAAPAGTYGIDPF